jgi:hypothetical protein
MCMRPLMRSSSHNFRVGRQRPTEHRSSVSPQQSQRGCHGNQRLRSQGRRSERRARVWQVSAVVTLCWSCPDRHHQLTPSRGWPHSQHAGARVQTLRTHLHTPRASQVLLRSPCDTSVGVCRVHRTCLQPEVPACARLALCDLQQAMHSIAAPHTSEDPDNLELGTWKSSNDFALCRNACPDQHRCPCVRGFDSGGSHSSLCQVVTATTKESMYLAHDDHQHACINE